MIPVSILTGFLGSGKTTLLRELLRHRDFSRTAVIINEFGEIGLDHDLVEASNESFITLRTGCLCCKVRDDLVLTLGDLLARRDAGTLPAFERVVIETSGLADPAPILHALMTDDTIAHSIALSGVVTTVDAVNGAATLTREPVSAKQAAMADRLVLTKTDLAPARDDLSATLAQLNPRAHPIIAVQGQVDPRRLFDGSDYDPSGRIEDVQSWLAAEALTNAGHDHEHDHPHSSERHDAGISTWCLTRDEPIRAIALTLFLETLAEHCGADLLRVKGILNITESPDRPAVIHGVQHVFHPLAWLDRWPSDDRRSRIVFITRNIPRSWVETLLAALDAEVAEAASPRA